MSAKKNQESLMVDKSTNEKEKIGIERRITQIYDTILFDFLILMHYSSGNQQNERCPFFPKNIPVRCLPFPTSQVNVTPIILIYC